MHLLILLFMFQQEVLLEGDGVPVPFDDHMVMINGQFIGWNQTEFWHWTEDGKLLIRGGGKGMGPGEFTGLTTILWDGNYYWCVDASTQSSSFFDRKGNFLFREPVFFRWLFYAGNDLFAVDTTRFNYKNAYPPMLRKIGYQLEPENKTIKLRLGALFKKATEKQVKCGYNFKLHWGVPYKTGWYFANQIDDAVWYYDRKIMEREQVLTDDQQGQVTRKILSFGNWQNRSDWKPREVNWWNTQSFLHWMGREENRLIVAYFRGYGESTVQVEIFNIGTLGTPLHRITVNGAVIGIAKGNLHSWDLNEDGRAVISKKVLP